MNEGVWWSSHILPVNICPENSDGSEVQTVAPSVYKPTKAPIPDKGLVVSMMKSQMGSAFGSTIFRRCGEKKKPRSFVCSRFGVSSFFGNTVVVANLLIYTDLTTGEVRAAVGKMKLDLLTLTHLLHSMRTR